jgi:uncharacterized protein (DUF1778 family)
MQIKHIQARVEMTKYKKLKKVAEMRNKTLNETIVEAIDEFTKKYTTVDPDDILFTAKKFEFKETDLSQRHAKYRFAEV